MESRPELDPEPEDDASGEVAADGESGADEGESLLWDAGREWDDYRLHVGMRAEDEGEVGLLFRYADESNYYTFAWGEKAYAEATA